jgi:hypothetical protein
MAGQLSGGPTPDYWGADYDAEMRALGQLGVRCGCGCGQDEFGGDAQVRTGHQGLVRATEFSVVFPDWDEDE